MNLTVVAIPQRSFLDHMLFCGPDVTCTFLFGAKISFCLPQCLRFTPCLKLADRKLNRLKMKFIRSTL